MSKSFRPYDMDTDFIFPPSLRDWLPNGHLAHFVSDLIDEMDLSAVFAVYDKGDGRGAPPYHPLMMIKLIVYGYCTGIYSSRGLEKATYDQIAFRFLGCDQHPDHDSIAEFRRRHLPALAAMFETVLHMCREMGLVGLGHTAIDGSKFKANASKHKAMSYGRMCETEKKLETEMADLKEQARRLLDEAERVDAEEDKLHGKGRRGDELPAELQRRESRLRRIREAMAVVQERAREHAGKQAEEARAKIEARKQHEEQTGKKANGREPKVADPDQVEPDKKAQYNFTDPDSRIMLDGASKSFTQAYNGQIAVDGDSQVIVAAALTQEANDVNQLVPMVEQIEANTGERPGKLSADAGYFSEKNLTDERLQGIDLFVPCQRQKHGAAAGQVISPETAVALASDEIPAAQGATKEDASSQPVKEGTPVVNPPTHSDVASCPAAANKQPTRPPLAGPSPTLRQQMSQKLSSPEGKAVYAKRKTIVEPVFGQIKEPRRFRRFSFRGFAKASAEFKFVCAIHNLLKLFKSMRDRAGRAAQMAFDPAPGLA